jgi:hypothetical protein
MKKVLVIFLIGFYVIATMTLSAGLIDIYLSKGPISDRFGFTVGPEQKGLLIITIFACILGAWLYWDVLLNKKKLG